MRLTAFCCVVLRLLLSFTPKKLSNKGQAYRPNEATPSGGVESASLRARAMFGRCQGKALKPQNTKSKKNGTRWPCIFFSGFWV